MKIVNILDEIAGTPVDPEVGIAIVKASEEPGVSVHLAVVGERIRPHYHKVSDEVYSIIKGKGLMTVGHETMEIREGDVITIPRGKVHSLINTGVEPCLVLFSTGPRFDPEKDRFFTGEE